MTLLIVGLLLFLGPHSIRIFAEGSRAALIDRFGVLGYKAGYALLSLIGLVLIVKGYAAAREMPHALWPAWTAGRHMAALLSLAAFILVAAAYVPGNRLKKRLRHPMVLGVKLWALGHLLANHTLADCVLFGSLLVWAVLDFRQARRRDRREYAAQAAVDAHAAPLASSNASLRADVLTLAIGLAAFWAFAFHLHASLIGVRPFG